MTRPLGRLLRDLSRCYVEPEPDDGPVEAAERREHAARWVEINDMLALADWLDGLAPSRSNPAAYRARAARLRRLAAELGEGR